MLIVRVYLSKLLQIFRLFYYRKKGYSIGAGTIIEGNVTLDKVYPSGIHIGNECLIARGVTILSHDHCKRIGPNIVDCLKTDTYIGNRCFVAVNATIMPGVHVGDECIVGACSIVTKDVPANCIVAGNPGRVIRKGIRMSPRAEIINWNPKEGFVDSERVI